MTPLALCLALACDVTLDDARDAVAPAPIPAERAAYVGTWVGDGVELEIRRNGMVGVTEAGRADDQPLTAWTEAGFTVGYRDAARAFTVDVAPHEDDGRTWMTVDGRPLRRVGPGWTPAPN